MNINRDRKGRFTTLKRKAFRYLAFSALFFGSLGFVARYDAQAVVYQTKEIVKTVTVEKDPEFPPLLKKICSCESTGKHNGEPRQFGKDGKALRGSVTPDDIGMCQISLRYHGADAYYLGYDVFTEEGNRKMALHLYNTQGTDPWNATRHCWK